MPRPALSFVSPICLSRTVSDCESQATATKSKWRGFLQFLGRATLITLLGSAGVFYYVTYRERHPGPQLPPDPKKKTIVVLGSGWGATSLLNTIDTAEYNVVSIRSVTSFYF